MGKNDKYSNKAQGGQSNARVDAAALTASAETAAAADNQSAQDSVQNEQTASGAEGGDTAIEPTGDAGTVTETPAAPTGSESSAPEASGEATATPAATEQPAAPAAEDKPVGSIVDAPRPIGIQRNSQDSSLLTSFAHQLEEYCTKMGRAVPVTPQDGAGHQLALYRLVCTILRQEGTVFTKAWSLFLQTVHEHADGAFSANRALRFFEHLKIDSTAKFAYQNLIHVATATADPKARAAALRTISIPSATTGLPVVDATEKLMAFYAP